MALQVLHLVGSPVDDFHADLSRLYAADCLEATSDPQHYRPHLAWVAPNKTWRFPADLSREAIAGAPPLSVAGAVERLVGLGLDVAVPQMFCPPGMTHQRALLDLLGIPYVGNDPALMALTMDKAKARAVVAAAGVAVPDGEVLRRGDRPTITPPAVVKPVALDNSVGVTLVRSVDGYPAALAAAFDHGDEALVERYVELGREVRCGVLDLGGELVGLPLEEYDVDAEARPIRGYADKLGRDGDGELELLAKDGERAWIVDVEDPLTAVVWEAARRCHVALGCRHHSLFDFRIDPDGRPWFLEAGLYCSFARQSVIPTMAAAAGIDLRDLFARSLAEAMASG